MENKEIISIEQFCIHHNIPESFIDMVKEYNLIEFRIVNNEKCIDHNDLSHLEKIMRIHFDLGVNFEGLDVIINLLKEVENLQNKLKEVNNKLAFYHY